MSNQNYDLVCVFIIGVGFGGLVLAPLVLAFGQ